jgi:hypothetical protein
MTRKWEKLLRVIKALDRKGECLPEAALKMTGL